MKITIGCDHAGVEYKSKIVEFLEKEGYQVLDVGTHGTESVDYPDYAHKVVEEVFSWRKLWSLNLWKRKRC